RRRRDRLPPRIQLLPAVAKGPGPEALYGGARPWARVRLPGASSFGACGVARDRAHGGGQGTGLLSRFLARWLLRHVHGGEARRQSGAHQSSHRSAGRSARLPWAAEEPLHRRALRTHGKALGGMARALGAESEPRAVF